MKAPTTAATASSTPITYLFAASHDCEGSSPALNTNSGEEISGSLDPVSGTGPLKVGVATVACSAPTFDSRTFAAGDARTSVEGATSADSRRIDVTEVLAATGTGTAIALFSGLDPAAVPGTAAAAIAGAGTAAGRAGCPAFCPRHV